MAETARLAIQYPDEGEDPFFVKIKSFFESVDTHLFANMADRNLFLRGGGVVSFNSATGVVTWGSNLQLFDFPSGLRISVLASSITLQNGQCAFIDTGRSISENVTVTLNAASLVANGPGKIVLFFRDGNRIIFRNGAVLTAGFSGSLVDTFGLDARVGTVTFNGVNDYVDVVFASTFPDTTYRVVGLVCDGPFSLYAPAADKSASGFRVRTVTGLPGSGVKADWKVERS